MREGPGEPERVHDTPSLSSKRARCEAERAAPPGSRGRVKGCAARLRVSGVQTLRMVRTLILHDRQAAETAGLLAQVLGPAMTALLTPPPEDWTDALACVLVLAPDGRPEGGFARAARMRFPVDFPVRSAPSAAGVEEQLRAAGEVFGDRLVFAGTVPADLVALQTQRSLSGGGSFAETSKMPGPELPCTGHGGARRPEHVHPLHRARRRGAGDADRVTWWSTTGSTSSRRAARSSLTSS